MPEEPENMLEHHGIAAACRIKEVGAEVAVGQHHRDRARQHRHHHDQQIRRDEPGPDEQRHFHQRHARRAHIQDGRDDVDRAHDGGSAHDMKCKNGHIHAHAHLHRQRRINRPAPRRRTARHKERTYQQHRRRRQQPEAPVVHARESHVGRADHHRNLPVGEADEGRHDGAEHHDQAMHRGKLVEESGLTICKPG